ncbi:hypothetical protein HZH68_014089 [Vespula germanica]|uniref:Ig-like domain-containing protein n=1 Tax=Vespula germanica TaxID=30212 RepID=A0A834JC57_VESGE|nr:hypothetical protein HZH68_014089 [Vespula germanica]
MSTSGTAVFIFINNFHELEKKIDFCGDIKVEIKMPREAEEGSTVELRCEWRLLGGAGLYSVKWYKDEHEFFRYVPDNDPKIQTFPQLGIHLDLPWATERRDAKPRAVGIVDEINGIATCAMNMKHLEEGGGE